ncbi:hypothetical protein SBY92_002785 [Candida maltosa Xu316]|uniref:Maf-like protein n=1 Tax=Candida maltosa (strain Xu316) TaxID=1245528 RepID=M3JWL4_CANMX|nr:hypothetical protein G210_2353 [Candida maltosa Xu316]
MTFNHPLLDKLQKYDFILGSTSPRRQEILRNNLGISKFRVIGSKFAEDLSKDDKTPLEYVQLTSKHKAEHILADLYIGQSPTIILTCDTIISCNDKVFEKPITQENQRNFFEYFGKHPEIDVISALTAIKVENGTTEEFTDYSISKLTFKNDKDLINAYISSNEGLEVAGGFKYQELGCLLFSSMDGDYLNIVGLPLKTFELLNKVVS